MWKRNWTTRRGEDQSAWVCEFRDANGKRRLKTFNTKGAAQEFEARARAVASGIVPEPLARGHRAMEFSVELPSNGWRKGIGREAIAELFRARFPAHEPSIDYIVLHVLAEMQPSSVVADVDNLLKPVLDALSGVAWVNDTQVCEMLVRRSHGRKRNLTIRIWQIPRPSVIAYQRAVETGLGEGTRGPRL